MNASPVLRCLKQAWVWALFFLVAAFVTVLFNVLGAITIAVLCGVMLPASRRPLAHVILVSLSFPLVVYGLFSTGKILDDGEHAFVLGAVGFGVFWMMYWLTRLALALEGKGSGKQREPEAGPVQDEVPLPSRSPARCEPCLPGVLTNPSESAPEFGLQQLQGCWSCRQSDLRNAVQTKQIDIFGNRFVLRARERSGTEVVVAHGTVEVDPNGVPQVRTFQGIAGHHGGLT